MNYVSAPVLDPTGLFRLKFRENGVDNISGWSLFGSPNAFEDIYHFPNDQDYTNTYSSSVNITYVLGPTGTASMATGTARNRISESQFLFIRRLA